MGAIDEIVSVTISTSGASVTQAGFGTPLILGTTAGWSERTRTYTSLTGVAADFSTSDAEYKLAAAVFAQSPRVSSLKIGRRSANVQGVKTITLSADLIASNVFAVTINGEAVSVTYATSHLDTMNAIDAAISAVDGIASVTVGGGSNRVLTITGEAGYDMTVTDAGITGGVSQATCAIATSVTAVTASSELSELQLEDDDWYCLLLTSTTVNDQMSAAAWIEAQRKIAIFRSNDATTLDATTTDLAALLEAKNYRRSAAIYHATANEYADAAFAGKLLPYDAGSETWAYKTLSGITAGSYTDTQVTNALGKNCNLYRTIGGVDVTTFGNVASGTYLDLIRGEDYIHARLQERIYQQLVDVVKIPYTDAGVGIIEAIVRSVLQDAVGQGILTNDPAPTVTVPLVADVSSTNRSNRLLPDIEFTAQFAGAIHTVQIAGTISV